MESDTKASVDLKCGVALILLQMLCFLKIEADTKVVRSEF
jgi:hypothetical protein